MNDIARDVEQLRDRLVETRRDFHRHPELAFQEYRTAGIVADRLDELGWHVTRGVAGTGVLGLLKGAGPGNSRHAALSSHDPKDFFLELPAVGR